MNAPNPPAPEQVHITPTLTVEPPAALEEDALGVPPPLLDPPHAARVAAAANADSPDTSLRFVTNMCLRSLISRWAAQYRMVGTENSLDAKWLQSCLS